MIVGVKLVDWKLNDCYALIALLSLNMSNNGGIKVIVRQRPAAPKDGPMSGDTVRINTVTKTISWANPAKTKRTAFR